MANVSHETRNVVQITNATMKCFVNTLLELNEIIENSNIRSVILEGSKPKQLPIQKETVFRSDLAEDYPNSSLDQNSFLR